MRVWVACGWCLTTWDLATLTHAAIGWSSKGKVSNHGKAFKHHQCNSTLN